MPLPPTELEELKAKLAGHAKHPEKTLRISSVYPQATISTYFTPTESQVILAAAVNEERVGKLKDALANLHADFADHPLNSVRDADAILREIEGEVGNG